MSSTQEKSNVSPDQMTSYYALLGVFSALSCCGILGSILIIAFNCRYQNHRQIKMSSPRLNIVGMVGAILLFLATPLHQKSFDPSNRPELLAHSETHTNDISCQFYESFIWCACMGFSLFYGSLVVKAYRVYQIFKVAGAKKMVIPDWHLFISLVIVLMIDAVILTCWHFTNPITFTSKSKFLNGYFFAWVAAELSHKFILMSVGLFVSWKNRLVNFSYLVDSPSFIFITFFCLVAMTIARCLVPLFSDPMIYCVIIQSILFICSVTLIITAHAIKIWTFFFKKDSFQNVTAPFTQKECQHVYLSDCGSIDEKSHYRVLQRNQELLQEMSTLIDQNRILREKVNSNNIDPYSRIVSKSFSKTSEDCGSIARSNPDSGVEIPDILHLDHQDFNSPTSRELVNNCFTFSSISAGSPISPHSCHFHSKDYCSLKNKSPCRNKSANLVAKNIEDYTLEEAVSLNSFVETVPQSPDVDLAKSIAQTYRLNEEEDVRYVSQCLNLSLQKRAPRSTLSPSALHRPRASTEGTCYSSPVSEYFKSSKPSRSWPHPKSFSQPKSQAGQN